MIKTVLLFIIGLVLICAGGDRLVEAAVAIARKLKISEIVVGATIVSLGTTLPEILVSTTAAFDGSSAVAAGNAFGSIICNTSLIAGLTQTIRPSKKISQASIGWRCNFFFLVAIAMYIWGIAAGAFNRPAGLMMLAGFAFYAWMNIKSASGVEETAEDNGQTSILKQILILAVCAALLYIGANLLVDNGILIAREAGVPERVIAVTFIALGTSLPELVTSMVASRKGENGLALGNVIGSNIFNIMMVLAVSAAVKPIPVNSFAVIDAVCLVVFSLVTLILCRSRERLSRLEGLIMLGMYAGYLVYICIR